VRRFSIHTWPLPLLCLLADAHPTSPLLGSQTPAFDRSDDTAVGDSGMPAPELRSTTHILSEEDASSGDDVSAQGAFDFRSLMPPVRAPCIPGVWMSRPFAPHTHSRTSRFAALLTCSAARRHPPSTGVGIARWAVIATGTRRPPWPLKTSRPGRTPTTSRTPGAFQPVPLPLRLSVCPS